MTPRPILVACIACLLATTLAAQGVKEEILTEGVIGGVITDGVNQWEITGASVTDGVLTDFEAPIGTDHQFSNWWWYRVAGDTAETIMPPPDTEDYTGNTATLTWNDVDGRGLFDAVLSVLLLNLGPGPGLLQSFVAENISGGNLDLQVFNYSDMDLDASAGNDSAIEASPAEIQLVDVTPGVFFGQNPEGYRVDAFPNVRNALNDTLIDDFADTGLPFGPGDYTGAFQFQRVIASGSVSDFLTFTCVNLPTCQILGTVFRDGFETGNTANWDATVP